MPTKHHANSFHLLHLHRCLRCRSCTLMPTSLHHQFAIFFLIYKADSVCLFVCLLINVYLIKIILFAATINLRINTLKCFCKLNSDSNTRNRRNKRYNKEIIHIGMNIVRRVIQSQEEFPSILTLMHEEDNDTGETQSRWKLLILPTFNKTRFTTGDFIFIIFYIPENVIDGDGPMAGENRFICIKDSAHLTCTMERMLKMECLNNCISAGHTDAGSSSMSVFQE